MKKINTIILMMFLAITSFSQSPIASDEEMIKALIKNSFDDIWSKFDSKKIEDYHTKDFLLLEHGEVWNNDTIANYVNKAILKTPLPTRINSFEFIDIKIDGDIAWVAYTNNAVISLEGKIIREAQWLESVVAVRTENGWRLQMMHSTRVKKE
jgi:uncharacterized protein (TIGR02246 family)